MRKLGRDYAIETARKLLAQHPLILDTETTGLDGSAEICEIAVVTATGDILLDELVKPRVPIPADASAIHGITDADVAGMMTFEELYTVDRLDVLLDGRQIASYNAAFDRRLLNQSCQGRYEDRAWNIYGATTCLMELYSIYYGQYSNYHGSYTWQSLTAAAEQCGLDWEGEAHRALSDARMSAQLLRFMAGQEVGA